MRTSLIARRHAFTLVEVLVVLGIIVIVLTFLLPVITKARRKALVLACPIAVCDYSRTSVSADLVLTTPNGSAEVNLDLPRGFVATHEGGCQWSLSGQTLAVLIKRISDSPQQDLLILRPMTNERFHHPDIREHDYVGLVDDDHFMAKEPHSAQVFLRSVRTGAKLKAIPPIKGGIVIRTIRPVPPGNNTPYIAVLTDGSVTLLRKDFSRGKTIFQPQIPGVRVRHENLGVDPHGQWAAWTEESSHRLGVKGVRAPAAALPDYLTTPSFVNYFADWTPDGHLLVSVDADKLAIIDRTGKMLRRICDRVPNGGAAWRKYYHQ